MRRALERGEAVAGLLEAHPEALAQAIDVVAHRVRGGAEAAIGHQQRAGGIIGEADAEQFARGGGARPASATTRCISLANS
jgi:hypothetical protein